MLQTDHPRLNRAWNQAPETCDAHEGPYVLLEHTNQRKCLLCFFWEAEGAGMRIAHQADTPSATYERVTELERRLDRDAAFYSLASTEGQLALLRAYLPQVLTLENQLDRTAFLQKLARLTNIDPRTMVEEIHQLRRAERGA